MHPILMHIGSVRGSMRVMVPTRAAQAEPLERCTLDLLAHDDVLRCLCAQPTDRARCHRLLFGRGAAHYQQGALPAACRIFSAALLYSAGAGSACYCRTARMLSHAYAARGLHRRAHEYLSLAEQHQPDAAAHVLMRLRLQLAEAAAAADAAAASAGTGPAVPRPPAAAGGGGGGDGGGTTSASSGAQLLQRLVACCDFQPSHLQVSVCVCACVHRATCGVGVVSGAAFAGCG